MNIKTIDRKVNEYFENVYGVSGEEDFLDMYHLSGYIDLEILIQSDTISEDINNLFDYVILGTLNFIEGVNKEETMHLADYDTITEDMLRNILIYKSFFGFQYSDDFTIEGIYEGFLDELREVLIDAFIKIKGE